MRDVCWGCGVGRCEPLILKIYSAVGLILGVKLERKKGEAFLFFFLCESSFNFA